MSKLNFEISGTKVLIKTSAVPPIFPDFISGQLHILSPKFRAKNFSRPAVLGHGFGGPINHLGNVYYISTENYVKFY